MAEEQKQQSFSTALTKVNNIYFPLIEKQLVGNGIEMDDYSKQCVMNSISAINNALDTKGITWNNPQLDQSNVTQILLSVASLKLNPSASPNEVYFQVRNVKIKKNGKDEWKKQIEMGIEGDGNDAILSRFGRNVKEVRQHWLVRSEDTFQYPTYNGLEMSPPQWTPTGKGDVIRVVYPVIKKSGVVEFYIAERHEVIKNLTAHVNNNLMNETFGIAKSRYDATAKQKDQINEKKSEILASVKELGLDGALSDPELQKYISPAWKDPQSRESMIVRKMRNNIVKKIPKDFGSTLAGLIYDENSNEKPSNIRQEVSENANGEVIDIEYTEDRPEEQPKKTEPQPEPEVTETKKEEKLSEKEPEKKEEKEISQIDISDDEAPF